MRLFQKNLRHTGYAIYKNEDGIEETIPTFTNDLFTEARFLGKQHKKSLVGVYGARIIMKDVTEEIKKYKEKYGIIPQDLTEELRTGFQSNNFLTQSYPRYYYK